MMSFLSNWFRKRRRAAHDPDAIARDLINLRSDISDQHRHLEDKLRREMVDRFRHQQADLRSLQGGNALECLVAPLNEIRDELRLASSEGLFPGEISVEEAADRVGVTRHTIRDWCDDGSLPRVRKYLWKGVSQIAIHPKGLRDSHEVRVAMHKTRMDAACGVEEDDADPK
jgi:hypothetical protein